MAQASLKPRLGNVAMAWLNFQLSSVGSGVLAKLWHHYCHILKSQHLGLSPRHGLSLGFKWAQALHMILEGQARHNTRSKTDLIVLAVY